MYLKKPAQDVSGSGGGGSVASPGTLLKAYPALLEFLSLSSWEDGSPRRPGTIRLLTEDGRWKCSLNDPENKRYAFMSGTTPEELLAGAEKHLRGDTVEWRPDRPMQSRKGK
jgi:hypothetical protein